MREVAVALPRGITMDTAYDGMSHKRVTRALKPLERDILCRVLSDVLHELREHQDLDHLMFSCGRGGIRMEAFEASILHNIREVINPRFE